MGEAVGWWGGHVGWVEWRVVVLGGVGGVGERWMDGMNE